MQMLCFSQKGGKHTYFQEERGKCEEEIEVEF